MREFDEKPLRNIDDAGIDLQADDDSGEDESESVGEEEFDALTARFKSVLGDRRLLFFEGCKDGVLVPRNNRHDLPKLNATEM